MTKQTTRYRVLRDFDYLSAGRVYSFSFGKCWINVRRVEDPETGTFIRPWQFRQALERGWIAAA